MISIIVLVHDNVPLSTQCLEALAEATRHGVTCEVLCIDNASTDDITPVREAGQRLERFRLLRNEHNLTFAEANNRAAAQCRGDRLLFLNNDVMLDPLTLDALRGALDDPRVGIAGARLLFPGRQRVQHAGLVPTLWGYVSNYGVGAGADDARMAGLHQRPAVSGAVLCLGRALFHDVGGFDTTFRWGYEDIDLCFRVRQRGLSVVCVGIGPSEHRESATLATRRDPVDLPHNYSAYRRRWNAWLEPREAAYVAGLRQQGIRRVVIVGDGLAGQSLSAALARAGIDTVAFARTRPRDEGCRNDARPLVMLEEVRSLTFDRLVVGTQFFFEIESSLGQFDPIGQPLFPVVWE